MSNVREDCPAAQSAELPIDLQFAAIPLPSITAHPALSSTAKIVYGLLNRLARIRQKRGKDTFRVGHAKLADQIGKTPRTVKRAIWQLRGCPDAAGTPQFTPLIAAVRTGRANWYRLLPMPESVPLDSVQIPEVRGDISDPSEGTKPSPPHTEKPSQSTTMNETNPVVDKWSKRPHQGDWTSLSPTLQQQIDHRLRQIGWGAYPDGREVIEPAITVDTYGASNLLSELEKLEDTLHEETPLRRRSGRSLVNPAAFLHSRLKSRLRVEAAG